MLSPVAFVTPPSPPPPPPPPLSPLPASPQQPVAPLSSPPSLPVASSQVSGMGQSQNYGQLEEAQLDDQSSQLAGVSKSRTA